MKSILTPFQKSILDGICKDKFITDNFCLGGGTALSEFYLKHRLSEDFDFFTESEISFEEIRKKLGKVARQLNVKSVEYREIQSSFNYFPFPKFGQGKKYNGLAIQSLMDIAISKIDTILTRKKARDFVDFYFIQKEHPFDIDFLLQKLEENASWKVDPLYLASCFLKVETLHDYPKMIKEFSPEEMVAYFLSLAKGLRERIVKYRGKLS